jgi:hypothetical protein
MDDFTPEERHLVRCMSRLTMHTWLIIWRLMHETKR